MILFSMFTIYLLVNVYMDIKYRRTKNVWHFLFLILGLLLLFFQGERAWWEVCILVILSLLSGLILEQFGVQSQGDTKMLIVSSVWIGTIISRPAVEVVLGVLALELMFLIIVSYVHMFRIKRLRDIVDFHALLIKALLLPGVKLPKQVILTNFPGAFSILFAALTFSILEVFGIGRQ